MPPQQLLLSWKDHNGVLVSNFENLLKGSSLVDCTLAAEGQYLKAHKIVLSACSPYFELLFSQENEKNPIVILKDVKFQELEAAVNFMYRGEVEVCEDRLTAFLEVANSLQIKGLGSDGETQDIRPSSPSMRGLTTTIPPKSHSREEVSFSQSENTGDGCITIDSDKNSKESSSHLHLPRRETSCSSPVSSTFATTSSYSLASASTSGPVRTESVSGGVNMKNNQRSSPSVSLFPSGDSVPSDVNTVIKSEPVTNLHLDEKSNETERDCDDMMKMEDQEDWEDPNLEYMDDDQASNQHDPGFSLTEMKTEESASAPAENISSEDDVWVQGTGGNNGGNTPAPQFASTFFQEHQPSPSPSFNLVSEPTSSITSAHQDTVLVQDADGGGGGDRRSPQFANVFLNEHQPSPNPGPSLVPAPDPAPVPGPASGVAPSRQGVPAGSARRGKTTTASRSGRYQCHDCSYSTSSSWCLSRHQLVHTGEKPYKCTVCTFASAQQCYLKAHMRKHSGEKPYKCTDCAYATTRQGVLKTHMRIHTGEEPYKCTVCTYATSRQDALKSHMYIHTGEKPYKCTVCAYATLRQGDLKSHMYIHTGEKPYRCMVCTYKTSHQVLLKRHMRIHTGVTCCV